MKLSFKKDYYAILLQNRQIWPRRCGEESRDFFISCQGLLNIRGPGQYCATLIFNKPWQEMKKIPRFFTTPPKPKLPIL